MLEIAERADNVSPRDPAEAPPDRFPVPGGPVMASGSRPAGRRSSAVECLLQLLPVHVGAAFDAGLGRLVAQLFHGAV
ncbi:hypothetical protein GCM10010371_00100 [Streptomyces subrutilus]|uniref:Uncharacterized protein n=1 Tax=Streptomyces subrutilus TaxID=36818 RepID=A0A918UZI3_9ACTN|nr:hypothetical protein GCM10010371_00100 [Streptomyces subrutilus]